MSPIDTGAAHRRVNIEGEAHENLIQQEVHQVNITIEETSVVEVSPTYMTVPGNPGGGYTTDNFNIDFALKNTDNLQEGSQNKYYSTTLVLNEVNPVKFGREITGTTTLTADDQYKQLTFNAVLNVQISVGTQLQIGGWVYLRIVGAGTPTFFVGQGETINSHNLTERSLVMIMRTSTTNYFVV